MLRKRGHAIWVEIKARNRRRISRFVEDFATQRSGKRAGRSRYDFWGGLPGHFIGLSSLADELLSAEAPSYHASKAGFSNYLEGLALALKPKGVYVTNVRFGFVDTKMAKGDFKPLMMSVEKAVDHLEACIRNKPVRYTAPRMAIPLVKFRRIMMRLGAQ